MRRRGFSHKLGGRPAHPPDIPRHLRKVITENLDAAIFTHGLRQLALQSAPERDVCFAPFEAQDHDFVLRFGPANEPIYCPVQLKVLVSKEVNPVLTPETLLNGLRKYSDASNLVVAVKIDRRA